MAKNARELFEQKKYDPLVATLVDRLGVDGAAALWVRAERRLATLIEGSQDLPALEREHTHSFIYPVCSLYVEMAAALGREEALALLMDFAHDHALENRKPFEAVVKAPGGKRLLIRLFAMLQPRLFGKDAGFEATIGIASSDHVHFDIMDCPYRRHTAELGVPEICNLFCTNDDIIYGDLPGVRFTRAGTLGRGADVCDFDLRLTDGMARQPKKLLVIGPGVIGSYLIHVLCEAGHDVTVLARGAWADTLEEEGLRLHHYLQRTDTVDYPRIVRELPVDEHFDAAFAVMRQDQMVALAPDLGRLDAPYVVCVGNDMHVDAVEEAVHAGSATQKQVLFGFQGTAGHREADRTVVVRLGAWHLTLGPAHGHADTIARAFFEQVFCGSYKANFEHDMVWWLACHAVSVLPFCYVAYRLGCDLTRATAADITQLTDAMREGYDVILAAGGTILPEGDDTFFEGPKRVLWDAGLRVMAKTALGRLCVTDHCKNAVDEMRALDEAVMELFSQVPDVPCPAWDALRAAMPSWDELG